FSSAATPDPSAEQIGQLQRQIVELKQELEELSTAQQQAEETIAALRATEPEPASKISWFSEPAALLHGVALYAEAQPLAPPARSAIATRPRTGEVRRGPISLEPQQ